MFISQMSKIFEIEISSYFIDQLTLVFWGAYRLNSETVIL